MSTFYRRLPIIFAVIAATSGGLYLWVWLHRQIALDTLRGITDQTSTLVTYIFLGLGAVLTMYLMLRYLGSVPKDREERLTITTELLAPLRAEIAKLSKDTGIVLTPDERAEVVKALTSPLWDQFSTQVTKELSDNFSAAVIDRLQLEKVRERIGEAQRRLKAIQSALCRRPRREKP